MKIKAVVKARGGGAQQWYNARQLSQLRSKCRTQYSWNLLLAGFLLHEQTSVHGYIHVDIESFAMASTLSTERLDLQTVLQMC